MALNRRNSWLAFIGAVVIVGIVTHLAWAWNTITFNNTPPAKAVCNSTLAISAKITDGNGIANKGHADPSNPYYMGIPVNVDFNSSLGTFGLCPCSTDPDGNIQQDYSAGSTAGIANLTLSTGGGGSATHQLEIIGYPSFSLSGSSSLQNDYTTAMNDYISVLAEANPQIFPLYNLYLTQNPMIVYGDTTVGDCQISGVKSYYNANSNTITFCAPSIVDSKTFLQAIIHEFKWVECGHPCGLSPTAVANFHVTNTPNNCI